MGEEHKMICIDTEGLSQEDKQYLDEILQIDIYMRGIKFDVNKRDTEICIIPKNKEDFRGMRSASVRRSLIAQLNKAISSSAAVSKHVKESVILERAAALNE